jgi:rare lipoprotein A
MRIASHRAEGLTHGPHFDAGPGLGLRHVCAVVGLGLMLLVAPVPARAEPLTGSPQVGQASWYGQEFARRRTASGETFDPQHLTGAHRTLPLGTKVRVTNLHNGRSVLVTINDRGPYRYRRVVDLSYGAARVLGMVHRGIARVRIELVES